MPKTSNGGGSEKKQPSAGVRRAIAAMISGEATTQRQAAEIAGIHENTFSAALRKPHVKAHLENEVRHRLGSVGLVAALNSIEHLARSAESEYVRADVGKHVLAINGIKPRPEAGYGSAGGGVSFAIFLPDGSPLVRIGSIGAQIGAPSVQIVEPSVQHVDLARVSDNACFLVEADHDDQAEGGG